MKILLHGAINYSNFGDFLFAKIFYEHIKSSGKEVEFYSHPKYGISAFFCKYLAYQPSEKNYKTQMKHCDALVFIPGGYFVECSKKDILSRLKHIKRYFLPALYFIKKGKPIYILGVGAGPFGKGLYRKLALKVLNHAEVIHVRNEESKQYCLELGVTKDIKVTADTALLIKDFMPAHDTAPAHPSNKKFMLHLSAGHSTAQRMMAHIVPAVKAFLTKNPEYQLCFVTDGLSAKSLQEEYTAVFREFHPISLPYDDPMKLCSHLAAASIVVTTKLHVGIVSSVLGRSVFSFPAVPEKTLRYYRQIGEADRCIPLTQVTSEDVLALLESKQDTGICVPQALTDLAIENLKAIPM